MAGGNGSSKIGEKAAISTREGVEGSAGGCGRASNARRDDERLTGAMEIDCCTASVTLVGVGEDGQNTAGLSQGRGRRWSSKLQDLLVQLHGAQLGLWQAAMAGGVSSSGAVLMAVAGREMEVGRARVSTGHGFIGVEEVVAKHDTAAYGRPTASTQQELFAGGRWREKGDFPLI